MSNGDEEKKSRNGDDSSEEEEMIILTNEEGEEVEVKRSVADQIGVVKTTLNQIPVTEENGRGKKETNAKTRIKLEGIDACTLRIILRFFEALSKAKHTLNDACGTGDNEVRLYMTSLTNKQLNDLSAVVPKCMSPSLDKAVVNEIAKRWKSMPTAQIRAEYDIDDDMTEEEKKEVEREGKCVTLDLA